MYSRSFVRNRSFPSPANMFSVFVPDADCDGTKRHGKGARGCRDADGIVRSLQHHSRALRVCTGAPCITAAATASNTCYVFVVFLPYPGQARRRKFARREGPRWAFQVHWRRHEGTGNPCKYGLQGPTLNHSNNANHKNKTKKPQPIKAETQSTQT